MKIAILGTRGIPNNYGGFEQCAEFLSVGLVKKGHSVSVYTPNFHTYKEAEYKGVKLIRKINPKKIFGNSISNFIYDYVCLKDAIKKDFDIILELGLITASLSLILCDHKDKLVVTNVDGIEWKRTKWSRMIVSIIKVLEKYGIKHSDYLIADNDGISEYLLKKYNRLSKMISYGTNKIKNPSPDFLKLHGLLKENYLLTIARFEPENNLEMMIDAYIKSKIKIPYIIVGNHLTSYGRFLTAKYKNLGVVFLGSIFNKNILDNLRYYSKYYLHGHSVGGTNPALLEAMAANTFIFSHKNNFNESVIEDNAFYFTNIDELVSLLQNKSLLEHKRKFIKNNLTKIDNFYKWELIINSYELYFKNILKESNPKEISQS